MTAPAASKATPAEILLVEDNPGDVELTKNAFEFTRFENHVTVAQSGEEALARLRKEPPHGQASLPDLILLDIQLPQKSGLEVLHDIRRDEKLKDIPVIMLTGSRMNTDILDSAELSANGYIVKPMTIEKLARALASLDGFSFALILSRNEKKP